MSLIRCSGLALIIFSVLQVDRARADRCDPLSLAIGHLQALELSNFERQALRELQGQVKPRRGSALQKVGEYQPGERVPFQGEPTTIKKFIGAGGQGAVYLVEKGGEPFSLKQYWSSNFQQELQPYYQIAEKRRVPIPRRWVDPDGRLELMNFVDGVGLDDVKHSMNLGPELRNKIRFYFFDWQKIYGGHEGRNVVLDIDQGLIYLIDPI